VIAAAPDRVALYSYAHVPHLFRTQRQIASEELPAPDAELEILALPIDRHLREARERARYSRIV